VPTSPPELGWRRSPSPGGGNSFVHPVNAAAAPAGLQRVAYERRVRPVERHAVPRLPVARRELPDRVDLLADVAHVRRGRVLRSLS
jgi:hypothetical protein